MNSEEKSDRPAAPSPIKNWLSLAGFMLAAASLFSFLLLFTLDTFAHFSNPYIGILTYLIAPMFLVLGIFLALIGWWRARRREAKYGSVFSLKIDLTRPRDRRRLGWFITGSIVFLLISALGSYETYHYSESVQFCGQACHGVMKPEMVTYRNGPHARVACVECHIGPGAEWFVKAKISGTYQVYSVLFHKYPTPILTPIHNLRPAQETCEQCHWPAKFVGNKVKEYHYFLGDETNTPFTVKLMLKVGGADSTRGPEGGIHWHMNVANKIEYIAAKEEKGVWKEDEARQTIPWVRATDRQGIVTEYREKGFTNDISKYSIRTMDCIDCHNRPAHRYRSPEDAVNTAMSLGTISPDLKWIKTNAVFVLTQPYADENIATQQIATVLSQKYPAEPRIAPAIAAVQEIYRDNFFPDMKASWKSYPENIGHKNWPGCTRCHDDEHKTADNKKRIVFNDCTTCHAILAQGNGAQLDTLSAKGQKFIHPTDEIPDGFKCSDCHNGGP